MIFGPKLSSLFRSRWLALLWAAGIVWAAVDFVGPSSAGHDQARAKAANAPADDSQPFSAQDAAIIRQVVEGK